MSISSARPLALVTGASSGIGFQLAKQFVGHGYDLLVAAEDAELESATRELQSTNGVQVEAVRVDLSRSEGVEELIRQVSAAGRPVAAVALNAGIGMSGRFTDTDLQQELRLVDLNCRSTVHLAKHVLRDMVARGNGRVLITSSIASTMPAAYEAVYSASKAFTQSFALALRKELADTGITVTSLMPGPTDTEFWDRSQATDTRLGASDSKDSAADVARMGFDAMMQGKERVVASSISTKLQGRLSRSMPDSLKAALHARQAEPGSADSGLGKPIGVEAHSVIDYGLLIGAVTGPPLLGLQGPALAIPIGWGAVQGALNATTDQPYALTRLVPFKAHGRIEALGVPALAATLLATRAYRQPAAKGFFAALLAALGVVYALTDWDATPSR